MFPVAAYFGLGWAADNPAKTKHIRNQFSQKAESGYEFALFQFKSFSSEPAKPPEKKKRKKGKNKQW